MPTPFSCAEIAAVLDVPIQKSTDRRRRVETAIRQIAGDCESNRTNRVRFVVARCVDIGRLATADRHAFAALAAEVLEQDG